MKNLKFVYISLAVSNFIFLYFTKRIYFFKEHETFILMGAILPIISFVCFTFLFYNFSKRLKTNKEFNKLSATKKIFVYSAWAIIPFYCTLSLTRFIFFGKINLKKDRWTSILITLLMGMLIFKNPNYRFLFYNNFLSPSFTYVIESGYSAKMVIDLQNEVSKEMAQCNDIIKCLYRYYKKAVLEDRVYRNMYSLLFALNAKEISKDKKLDESIKLPILIETNFQLIKLYQKVKPYHYHDFSFSILSPIAGFEATLISAVDVSIDAKTFLQFLEMQEDLIEKNYEKTKDLNLKEKYILELKNYKKIYNKNERESFTKSLKKWF